ncbi:MAG: hypothetical protein A2855_01110 [Candidatus Liptonbacteria bacterium RIFCSPHIGHO2_01_FULL_57_28]|uniref:DUF11 domain-containing protein n=1 Tax=Candidatus Liptonbacteria bacterium RIFCSPHIGHO2_01_FULL_57_28 TaxID=1798647 RepID=A0A1G2C9L9_9BACT|nr:MAG: hypothetical protein A2855_01110 [Candidatus Liptonbacteria bacterium RIFCSPHIGHO2_01_FULL_57_28]
MTKYTAKKITLLVLFGLVALVLASIVFAGSASAAEPSVQTRDASEIGDDSAQLNGYLYTNGEDTTYWFEYGTDRDDLDEETSEREVSDRDSRVTVFNEIRNGLDQDETYYFRLVAENDDGIDRGGILSFRTDDDGNFDEDEEAIVETGSVSVRDNLGSVTMYGDVRSGGYAQVWFRYGQNRNSLAYTSQMLTYFGSVDETFSRNVSGLMPGATYYYQAVARNDNGTSYGDIRSFVAVPGGNDGGTGTGFGQAPAVTTISGTATGQSSASLRAQVNPNGTLSSVWFQYGRTAALGSATTRDPAGSGTGYGDYSANLIGLAPGATYYYRAAAQNASGVSYGQVLSFSTPGAPVVPPVNPPTVPPTTPPTNTPAGAPDCFAVTPALSSTQLRANEDFTYTVTYRNNCGYALTNGKLEITLPLATDYADTNYPFVSRDGNVITYDLGSIADDFQSAVTVNGKVRSQVQAGDSLIFQANITYTARGLSQSATGYLSAMIVEGAAIGTSTLSASAADTLGGLFRSGWFWLVLFLILIALFVFWLATRRRDSEDEDEDEDTVAGH